MDSTYNIIAADKLGLRDVFSAGSLSDASIDEKITNLQAGEILLIATGELPKIVFNAMHAYNGSNVLLQVREGASSLSSLLQSGRPHLRCGGPWELGVDKIADTNLKQQMLDLGHGICNSAASDWRKPVHRIIGNYITAAQQPDSTLSQYFKDLKIQIQNPANDRIACGLQGAMSVLDFQTNVTTTLNNVFHNCIIKVATGFAATSVSGLINNVSSNTSLLAAPEVEETVESPSISTVDSAMDAQTWLKLATVTVTATATLVVLARCVNWSEKFNYCKKTLAHSLFGNRKQPVIDLESKNQETMRLAGKIK